VVKKGSSVDKSEGGRKSKWVGEERTIPGSGVSSGRSY